MDFKKCLIYWPLPKIIQAVVIICYVIVGLYFIEVLYDIKTMPISSDSDYMFDTEMCLNLLGY